MATFRKRGNNWRAEVSKRGIRKSRTFHTKARAVAWATKLENDILDGVYGTAENKTFGELLQRYEVEVSKQKKGYRWEAKRIGLFLRDPLADVRLEDLSASDIAAWRDRRLQQVQPASVRREWNLLNHAINIAIREWEWLQKNPMTQVRRPPPARARDRLFTEEEIERLCYAAGYEPGAPAQTATARTMAAFLFACETAMRAGEIAALRPQNINKAARTAYLEHTKNGSERTVPLSAQALRILDDLPDGHFALTSMQISTLFRKIRKRALIDDATFHDSRHYAITRLAKKLDVLDLARMVGIRDLKILMVYYNESAEEIAKKL
jgi:integrase